VKVSTDHAHLLETDVGQTVATSPVTRAVVGIDAKSQGTLVEESTSLQVNRSIVLVEVSTIPYGTCSQETSALVRRGPLPTFDPDSSRSH
jgi:hypothetical protein